MRAVMEKCYECPTGPKIVFMRAVCDITISAEEKYVFFLIMQHLYKSRQPLVLRLYRLQYL